MTIPQCALLHRPEARASQGVIFCVSELELVLCFVGIELFLSFSRQSCVFPAFLSISEISETSLVPAAARNARTAA